MASRPRRHNQRIVLAARFVGVTPGCQVYITRLRDAGEYIKHGLYNLRMLHIFSLTRFRTYQDVPLNHRFVAMSDQISL